MMVDTMIIEMEHKEEEGEKKEREITKVVVSLIIYL